MEINNNKYILPLIIGATVVLSLLFLSQTDIYIKQIGGVDSNGRVTNTISVSGDGKVYTKPDMAMIQLSFTELAPNSQEALNKVNQKINQATQIAQAAGVKDEDISTTSLNVYTEYDYNGTSRIILGQRAAQSLEIKVKDLDEQATKAAQLIDALAVIENAEINGISFDIEDKTELFTQARELAYNKAEQKAKELAKLSGVKLVKPVAITDVTYDVSAPIPFANVAELKVEDGFGGNTQVPSGQMAVTSQLSILWGME